MLQKIQTITTKYNQEIEGINPDFRDDIQEKMRAEIGERFSTAIGPVREVLRQEAENLHQELEDARNPMKQLSRLAVQSHETVTPGILGIINSLPGIPPDMLGTLVDQAKNPCLQLALFGQIDSRSGEQYTALKERLLAKVAVDQAHIENLANAEKKRWLALADACDVPGDHSHAKLNYGHQITPLDKILAD